MELPLKLTELWELFGTLCEEIALDLQAIAARLEQSPHIWNWVAVWLGLFWICLRWTRKVIDANERRIYQAAEARLSTLVHEAGGTPADSVMPAEPAAEADAQPASERAVVPPSIGPKRRRRSRPKRKARPKP